MIEIYCDGACSGNPGPGGWAFIIPSLNYEDYSYVEFTTNNKMELTACIEALNYVLQITPNEEVTIYTDSQYIVNTMNCNWKIKKNFELWRDLKLLISQFSKVSFVWVKGHSGNQYNERCDELAVKAYKNKLIN